MTPIGLLADKRIALSTCYSGDSVLSVPTPCTTSCAVSLALLILIFVHFCYKFFLFFFLTVVSDHAVRVQHVQTCVIRVGMLDKRHQLLHEPYCVHERPMRVGQHVHNGQLQSTAFVAGRHHFDQHRDGEQLLGGLSMLRRH